MKNIREKVMYGYYQEWKTMKRKDRGRHIEEIAMAEQIDKSTVHRWFNRFDSGKRPSRRSDKGLPRFSVGGRRISREQMREWTMKVAGLKMALLSKEGKTADTESVVRALVNKGEMPPIPVSTMNRWLNDFDMSIRTYKRVTAAAKYRLMASHPNECWLIDATTSELFYLRNSDGKRLVRDTSGILTDKNHREEILTKKGYSRLLLFVFVDLFSSAFWYRAYVTPGESSAVWLRAMLEAMMPKKDQRSVFRGIPSIIYCDKGSGIGKSTVIAEVCESLGIQLMTHGAGNARAGSRVESRIGRIKARIEKWMSVENISSIDRYNELAEEFIIAENINNGFYQVWSQIHKKHEWLREFDPAIRDILAFNGQKRVVDAWGCISIGNIDYYVSTDLKGDNIEIYTLPDGTLKAIDRHQRSYDLIDPAFQGRRIGEFRSVGKSNLERQYEEAISDGRRIKKNLAPEDFILHAPENVVIFNKPGIRAEVNSPLDIPPFTSVEDAWYQIVSQTGYGKNDLPEDYVHEIDQGMLFLISINGEIPRDMVFRLIDAIKQLSQEENAL